MGSYICSRKTAKKKKKEREIMTVGELMEWLKEFPEDYKVIVVDPDDSNNFSELNVIIGGYRAVKLLA